VIVAISGKHSRKFAPKAMLLCETWKSTWAFYACDSLSCLVVSVAVLDTSITLVLNCQGTLPWQPNNVAIMKANWYYVHSLHVRHMLARFRFATTC